MVNIKDIAREAQVSIATVSRVLDPTKRELVSIQTRCRIEEIIQKHRYTPNRAARTLSRNSSDTIGMLTPFSSDVVKSPYFAGLIAGIIEGISFLQYDLKWVMIRDEEVKECNLDEMLQKHSLDGIVFLCWKLYPRLIDEIEHRENIPAVLINDFDPRVRCSIVYSENLGGVFQICQHFKDRGYKRIGMMRGPEAQAPDARDRYLAFRACARKLGYEVSDGDLCRCPRYEEKAAYEAMLGWIERGDLPNAIFCVNDDIARGVIRALQDRDVRIPGQVAVAGYDDSQRIGSLDPPLTSVRQPLETMGHAAIENLAKLITGRVKGPIQLRFEPELIVRETT